LLWPPCLQELLPRWPTLPPAAQETVFQAARVTAKHELWDEVDQRLLLALAACRQLHLVTANLEPANSATGCAAEPGAGAAAAAAEPDNRHLLSEAIAAFLEASEGAGIADSEALLRPLQLLYLSGRGVGGAALRVRRYTRPPCSFLLALGAPVGSSTASARVNPCLDLHHRRICLWEDSRSKQSPAGQRWTHPPSWTCLMQR
jgi:hypothetical protein